MAAYSRRTPETTLLYRVVQENLETFLAEAEESDRAVPRFVERELRDFLDCGILSRGFLRVRCKSCGEDRVVAFSCKGRGFCPSCTSRRMSDTAAHLVDRVFPEAPVRQWVLSLPIPLRYRVAYDHELCSAVLGVFLRTVFGALRCRAKKELGVVGGRGGSVTFVQRFGSSINLHTHFHALVLDGVYADPEEQGSPQFFALSPPTDEEIARVTATLAKRIVRLLMRRGLLDEEGPPSADPLAEEEPLLAACAQASVRHRIATGVRAGRPVMRLGDRIEIEDVESRVGEQCASVQGFSLHAGVAIGARDRKRLERICRYISRPPIARERLSELPDGRIAYRLRHPWRDGTTHVVFEPTELLEKLAVLVPWPRSNALRYHGVFAPGSKWREGVIRDRSEGPAPAAVVPDPAAAASQGQGMFLRPRRLAWAKL
ncbi:MAG: transposase, partial [bacterium]|nr:transposase [bacterium]